MALIDLPDELLEVIVPHVGLEETPEESPEVQFVRWVDLAEIDAVRAKRRTASILSLAMTCSRMLNICMPHLYTEASHVNGISLDLLVVMSGCLKCSFDAIGVVMSCC